MYKFYVALSLMAIVVTSCEKDITIKTKAQEPQLVVEAIIENNEFPLVFLSNSLDYFGQISPQQVANSFVSGATITINNGTITHTLREYAQPIGGGITVKFYSADALNPTTAFVGQVNKTYKLAITTGGKSYTASTTIPIINRRIDSFWWANVPQIADTNWKRIFIKAYDPPGLGDNIRYYTKRNSEPFYAGVPTSAFDDAFIDGTQYEFEIIRGVDRNNARPDGIYSQYFKRGDTVTFKTSQIDKATYDFWRTMEYNYQSIGNPFSTPIKVLSNIKGAPALGYFGGYGAQFHTLIIPR